MSTTGPCPAPPPLPSDRLGHGFRSPVPLHRGEQRAARGRRGLPGLHGAKRADGGIRQRRLAGRGPRASFPSLTKRAAKHVHVGAAVPQMRRNKEGLQGGSIEMSCSGTNSVRCWRKRSTGGRRSTSIAPPSGAMRTDSPRRRALIDRSKLNRVILSADIIHELLTMLQRAPGFYEFSCSEGPGGAVEAHPGHLGLI